MVPNDVFSDESVRTQLHDTISKIENVFENRRSVYEAYSDFKRLLLSEMQCKFKEITNKHKNPKAKICENLIGTTIYKIYGILY